MKKKFTSFLLLSSLWCATTFAQSETASVRTIQLDVAKEKGATVKVWQECVGAGRANEGLRADWQEQLKLVKKEIGFKYLRFHGLLHDDMGVYFEDKNGNPIYNWQYIDALFDFMLSINVKPFVELSFMPKALASGDNTVFWWKGNVTPPKSYDKWADLVKALTQHFTERYGKEEVKTWYFEVWNEPNHKSFFTGTQEDYLKIYDYSARAIKSVSQEYRVGGPATAGNGWVTETINYCVNNHTPIDFISTHTYATINGVVLDEDGKKGKILSRDRKSITKDVTASRKKIENSSLKNLELHYTEWSTSPSPFDPVHDSYQSASFILDKIKGTEKVANSMSYWTFTDIFEEPGPRTTPFHGGFGLLNYQSIKKPSYHAYKFLSELGETELANSDSASWACRDKNGNLQLLFWNITVLNKNDSIKNDLLFKRDLPAKTIGKVHLDVANIPAGKYELQVYKVGYKANDAYAVYQGIGSPNQLTKAQEKQIKDATNGEPIEKINITVAKNKSITKDIDMRENDVYLLKWVKR